MDTHRTQLLFPEEIDRLVACDLVDPATEIAMGIELIERSKGLDEGLLREIVGIVFGGDHPMDQAVDRPLEEHAVVESPPRHQLT